MICVALGCIACLFLLFFFGPGGRMDYRDLLAYRFRLEANIDDLKETNRKLMDELEALGSDPERIALQARELGYFREGEKVVRIEGAQAEKNRYTVGTILNRAAGPVRTDWPFKVLGLGLPVALFLVSIALRRRVSRENGNRGSRPF